MQCFQTAQRETNSGPGHFFRRELPIIRNAIKVITNNVTNIKKIILAMPAAAVATPVKPKIAAMMEIMKNAIAQPNIQPPKAAFLPAVNDSF